MSIATVRRFGVPRISTNLSGSQDANLIGEILEGVIKEFDQKRQQIAENSTLSFEGKQDALESLKTETISKLERDAGGILARLKNRQQTLEGQVALAVNANPQNESPSDTLRDLDLVKRLEGMDAFQRLDVIEKAIEGNDFPVLEAIVRSPSFVRQTLGAPQTLNMIRDALARARVPAEFAELESIRGVVSSMEAEVLDAVSGIRDER